MGNTYGTPIPEDPTKPTKPTPFLEKPWRTYNILKDGWTPDVQDKLLKDISSHLKDMSINIVFVGPIASGKSSLLNSYYSIANKRLSVRTQVGKDSSTNTLFFRQIKGTGDLENVIFFDVIGFEDGEKDGLQPFHVEKIVQGEIDPGQNMAQKIEDGVKANDKLIQNCVVYVLDAENIKLALKEDTIKKFQNIKKKLKNNKTEPSRVVLLTKMDCVSKEIEENLTNVFKSIAAHKVVKQASETTGVPIGHIFPVKNYVHEQDLDLEVNILLLLALQKIVHFAIDNVKGAKDDNFSSSKNATTKEKSTD